MRCGAIYPEPYCPAPGVRPSRRALVAWCHPRPLGIRVIISSTKNYLKPQHSFVLGAPVNRRAVGQVGLHAAKRSKTGSLKAVPTASLTILRLVARADTSNLPPTIAARGTHQSPNRKRFGKKGKFGNRDRLHQYCSRRMPKNGDTQQPRNISPFFCISLRRTPALQVPRFGLPDARFEPAGQCWTNRRDYPHPCGISLPSAS